MLLERYKEIRGDKKQEATTAEEGPEDEALEEENEEQALEEQAPEEENE